MFGSTAQVLVPLPDDTKEASEDEVNANAWKWRTPRLLDMQQYEDIGDG